MENLQVLIIGVLSILGIVGVLALVDKFNSILSRTFMTKEACKDCRSRCSNAINLELKTISQTQTKQNVILTMIANKLGLEGVKSIDLNEVK